MDSGVLDTLRNYESYLLVGVLFVAYLQMTPSVGVFKEDFGNLHEFS